MSDNTQQLLSKLAPVLTSPLAGKPAPIKLTYPGHFNNLMKEAYNKSTIGLADQLVSGQQRYDLSQFQYGTLFDTGATVLGFLFDIPAYIAGGGIGTATLKQAGVQFGKQQVAKQAAKGELKKGIEQTTKILANNNANPSYLNKVRTGLYKTFVEDGERLVFDSSGLALISGTHDYLNQSINEDDVNFAQVMSKSLVGLASFPVGKTFGVAATSAFKGKVPSAIARVTGEATGFMSPYAWEKGELLPSPEDIAITGGILGGATLASRGLSGYTKNLRNMIDETNAAFGNKSSVKFKDRPENIQKTAQELLIQQKEGQALLGRIFYDKDGDRVFIQSYKDNKITFRKESSNVIEEIDDVLFYDKFNIENSQKSPRFTLIKSIGEELNRLGITSVDDVQKAIFSIRGGKIPENLGSSNRGFDQLSNKELFQLSKKLYNRNQLDTIAKQLAALETNFSRSYLGGPFGLIQRGIDKLTLDMFPRQLGWMRSVEAKLARPGVALEAKYMLANVENHATLQASVVGKIADRLRKAGIYDKMGDDKLMASLTGELETMVGITPQMSNAAKEIRLIYNDLFNMLKQEGIDIVGFENKYAARFLRADLAEMLKDIRMGVASDLPELYSGINKLSNSPDAKKKAAQYLDRLLQENKDNRPVYTYFQTLKEYYKDDAVKVFTDLDRNLLQQSNKPFYNITKQRTGDISWVGDSYNVDIFETNAVANLLNYTRQAANQIATKRYFGTNFEQAITLADDIALGKVGSSPDRMTADALKDVIARVSGYIELDPLKNYKNKGLIQDLINFQIATKIGGGTATLVNVTQPFISSLFLSNYRIGVPSYMKRFVSGNRKEMLQEMGFHKDTEFLKTIEVLTGTAKRGNRPMDKAVDVITKATGFTGINKVNLDTSASIAMDTMQYLNRIANGEQVLLKGVPITNKAKEKIINDTLAGEARQAWAKRKLYRDFGVIWDGKKNLTADEFMNGAIKFSKDSQLQRNYLKEPLFLTDPRFRPFLVLKTFGFKQAKLIKDGLNREIAEGNVLPVLRLAVGAGIGGKFIINGIETIQNLISGQDEYDWRQSKLSPTSPYNKDASILENIGTQFENLRPGFFGGDENYKRTDYWLDLLTPTIDEISAVGALGVVSDFMAAENKMSTLGYIIEPVIWDDVTTVWNGIQETMEDINDYGTVGALKRSPQNFSKIFGSNIKQLSRRLETPQQLEGRLKSQRTRIHREIIEDVYRGEKDLAKRKIISWNKAHPDNPLLEPDAEEILLYVFRQQEKRKNP